MKVLLVFVTILIKFQTSAQIILITGKQQNRDLVWADFKSVVADTTDFDAYTSTKIFFSSTVGYKSVKSNSHDTIHPQFSVTLMFDNLSSWVRSEKKSDYLLKHEQGHFDIARLFAMELYKKLNGQLFEIVNYKEEAQNIYKELSLEYIALHHQYDDETNHSKNTEVQHKWNAYFDKLLNREHNLK